MPSLNDVNFHQAVVYIEEHNEDGAIGIIINKPIELSVEKLLSHLDIEASPKLTRDQKIYMGGPVAQDQGFVLHETNDHQLEISTSKETLTKIGDGTGPKEFIITLGYSGWQPGQLEKEIINNDWLIAPYSADIILRTPSEDRWKLAAKTLGIDINHLSNQDGHA